MNIENEKIRNFLETLERMVHLLKQKQSIQLEDYKKNIELQLIVERALHKAIQACIDIGARIIAIKGFKGADSYSEIFKVLNVEGDLEPELCKKMILLVGLRNILVHEYFRIDPEKVYHQLQNAPCILEEFAKWVIMNLGQSAKNG